MRRKSKSLKERENFQVDRGGRISYSSRVGDSRIPVKGTAVSCLTYKHSFENRHPYEEIAAFCDDGCRRCFRAGRASRCHHTNLNGSAALQLDTQGTDIVWTPAAYSGSYNQVYIDSDIYFVGSDTEPSASQFDSAEDPVQTAVFLKNYTDDAGEVTNSVLHAYYFDIDNSSNAWLPLVTTAVTDGSWAKIRVVVSYDLSYADSMFSVYVNDVLQADADGNTQFVVANADSFKAAANRKLNTVSFRGTGAIDNFVGTAVQQEIVRYTLTVATMVDGEAQADSVYQTRIQPGTSASVSLPNAIEMEGYPMLYKLVMDDGTTYEFTPNFDDLSVECTTAEHPFTIDNTGTYSVSYDYATDAVAADTVIATAYYRTSEWTEGGGGETPVEPEAPSIAPLEDGSAPLSFDDSGNFVVRFVAPQAGITYTLQAAATLGAEFADVADASAVSADAGDVIELKAPATAEMQFFRVKASN